MHTAADTSTAAARQPALQCCPPAVCPALLSLPLLHLLLLMPTRGQMAERERWRRMDEDIAAAAVIEACRLLARPLRVCAWMLDKKSLAAIACGLVAYDIQVLPLRLQLRDMNLPARASYIYGASSVK